MDVEEESLENSSYENLKLICKGHAHCGIFFAALDLHKEITPIVTKKKIKIKFLIS